HITPAQGEGDGVVTFTREHTGESGSLQYRDTKYTYDYRNRLVKIQNAAEPHAFFVYDNVDRVVKAALFSQLPAGSEPAEIDSPATLDFRGIYVEASYSQRGLAFRGRMAIEPASTSSAFLETHAWYDALGRTIGQWAPNGPCVKTTFNALGQVVTAYATDRGNDGLPGAGSFAQVYVGAPDYKANLTADVVFEQTTNSYRANLGILDLVTERVRTHDAPDTKVGDLALFSGGDVNYVITTYGGLEYNKAARVVGAVEFGTRMSGFTSGGAAPSLDSSDPPRWIIGSNEITVGIKYDQFGQFVYVIDPLGRITRVVYDDLGREIAVIENAQGIEGNQVTISWDATLSPPRWKVTDTTPGEVDADRVVSTVYRVLTNRLDQVAHRLNGSGTDTP
ncbi:MAG: hypothetical protein L0219_19445, partial [Phycisphaerales bacterium]|nr:hypothetical protein [Phycisphaerales bacterium]